MVKFNTRCSWGLKKHPLFIWLSRVKSLPFHINLTQYKNDVIPVVYRNSFIYQIKIIIKTIINTTNYDDYLIWG